jgi:hypothetical protein
VAKRKNQFRNIDEICALPGEAWLTSAEMALYLNTTPAALAIRRSNGSGPEYAKQGDFIRYQKKSADTWLMGKPT